MSTLMCHPDIENMDYTIVPRNDPCPPDAVHVATVALPMWQISIVGHGNVTADRIGVLAKLETPFRFQVRGQSHPPNMDAALVTSAMRVVACDGIVAIDNLQFARGYTHYTLMSRVYLLVTIDGIETTVQSSPFTLVSHSKMRRKMLDQDAVYTPCLGGMLSSDVRLVPACVVSACLTEFVMVFNDERHALVFPVGSVVHLTSGFQFTTLDAKVIGPSALHVLATTEVPISPRLDGISEIAFSVAIDGQDVVTVHLGVVDGT